MPVAAERKGGGVSGFLPARNTSMLEPHWETLKTFVRSLMIGADWHGLHVIVISDSPILADATTVLAGTWGLPPAQVHA